jgi:hypothetical protein
VDEVVQMPVIPTPKDISVGDPGPGAPEQKCESLLKKN